MPYAKVEKECESPLCSFKGPMRKNRRFCSPDCYHDWRKFDKMRFLDNEEGVGIFEPELVVEGDTMCANDIHIPYTDPDAVQKFLAIADKFDIRQAAFGGDILDVSALIGGGRENKVHSFPLDREIDIGQRFFEVMLDHFDQIYVCMGNHDWRALKAMDMAIRGDQLGRMLTTEVGERVFFTTQTYMEIKSGGEEFRYTHPKNYSRHAPKVEKALAGIHNQHILGTHGHLFGLSFDKSGQYVCCQLGTMQDQDRVPYSNLIDSKHPRWTTGFGMVRDGHVYPFMDGWTDWDFWLGEIEIKDGED